MSGPTVTTRTPAPHAAIDGAAAASDTDNYLPDFCSGPMTVAIVLIAELVAIVVTLAHEPVPTMFWIDLARASMFLLWVGLGSAFVMCRAGNYLATRDTLQVTVISLALLTLTTALVSEVAWLLGRYYAARAGGFTGAMFPSSHLSFVVRNVAVSAIVSALMLRYFYVAHQWRRNVQMEARSRIQALQARIRPHFLFNSMNTIAALTRTDGEAAEQVVEDLADLFRASLAESNQLVHLREEFEMARIYERIERRRLGERLHVQWDVDALPPRALIPGLTVQPLLENAIYHGIEPLPDGGTVTITGTLEPKHAAITISNPVGPGKVSRRHDGNQMALTNVRQRMELAFAGNGSLEVDSRPDQFRVTLRVPLARAAL